MNIRGLLESFSRGIVLKKFVKGKLGKRTIYVSPEAGLRYWKPGLNNNDNMMLNVIQKYVKSDSVIWDVGANLGLFSFNALVNLPNIKCLLIEPDIWLCNLIRKSSSKNMDWNIDLLPFATSNKVGLATFNIANRSRQTNFLSSVQGSTQTGGTRVSLLVPTITLDFLYENYSAPDFIKIDVEGAEGITFEGADKLLKNCTPHILCECSENNFEPIKRILSSERYHFYDAESLPDLRDFNPKTSENFIAVPK